MVAATVVGMTEAAGKYRPPNQGSIPRTLTFEYIPSSQQLNEEGAFLIFILHPWPPGREQCRRDHAQNHNLLGIPFPLYLMPFTRQTTSSIPVCEGWHAPQG